MPASISSSHFAASCLEFAGFRGALGLLWQGAEPSASGFARLRPLGTVPEHALVFSGERDAVRSILQLAEERLDFFFDPVDAERARAPGFAAGRAASHPLRDMD